MSYARIHLSCFESLHLQWIVGQNRGRSNKVPMKYLQWGGGGKVPYISLLRRANLVTLKGRRTQISLRFAHNAVHSPHTSSLFPSEHLCPPPRHSASRKISLLAPIKVSTEIYRGAFIPHIVEILNEYLPFSLHFYLIVLVFIWQLWTF